MEAAGCAAAVRGFQDHEQSADPGSACLQPRIQVPDSPEWWRSTLSVRAPRSILSHFGVSLHRPASAIFSLSLSVGLLALEFSSFTKAQVAEGRVAWALILVRRQATPVCLPRAAEWLKGCTWSLLFWEQQPSKSPETRSQKFASHLPPSSACPSAFAYRPPPPPTTQQCRRLHVPCWLRLDLWLLAQIFPRSRLLHH